MARRLAQVVTLCALVIAAPTAAPGATLKEFYGAYVGVATVEDPQTGRASARDMDIVIAPYHGNGFRLRWITVVLVDGRRDVPGVRRRVQTAIFEPSDDGKFFVEVKEGSLFRTEQAMQPMAGDPVRWAALLDDTLRVTTFQILDNGRYEMQIYDRRLTETGLDLYFERVDDDVLVRRIVGRAARANMDRTAE